MMNFLANIRVNILIMTQLRIKYTFKISMYILETESAIFNFKLIV